MDMGGGKLVPKIRLFCSLEGGMADARMECSGMPAKGLSPVLSTTSSQADSGGGSNRPR